MAMTCANCQLYAPSKDPDFGYCTNQIVANLTWGEHTSLRVSKDFGCRFYIAHIPPNPRLPPASHDPLQTPAQDPAWTL